ncbi:MAG TPA: HAMP domain-containing sensor histidine kinase [Anaerolineae bacterium]|nr:HAMP domain-containing sensor histidine kinase [Anaerolineae bacterium]
MFHSLNSRLLLSYITIILTCLVLVGLGLLVFVRSSPLWTRVGPLQLEAAAQATIAALRQAGPLKSLAPDQLQALLAQAAADQQVRILLLDAAGRVRFDSEGTWQGKQLEEPLKAPAAQGRVQGTLAGPGGGRWTFAGQAVPAADGSRQIVAVVAPRARLMVLAWFAENFLPPLVRAGAVALVLSVLLALLVSRSVAAPLRRVASAAQALARGKAGTRAPVSGPAEVQDLARSFNTMAERVEAARRSQRDFVANVSHELKTPLTSIQGFSQALLDGTASTPETTARAAHVIHDEAERMRRMVDELLTLARFDAGEVVMARERLELGPLLQACVERMAPQAQAAGVALERDVPEPLSVAGDGDRLAQVFINLLDNALTHTPTGGKVTLAARRAERTSVVEVTVTDTGTGIPAEALPRLFERFYQVDQARPRGRGAGLGLAIVKEIVEAHGGTIVAESVVGLGSRFTVRLPMGEESTQRQRH